MPRTVIRGRLKVVLPDGTVIMESKSADTFVKAIDEAVKAKNTNSILKTAINIKGWCGFPLISKTKKVYSTTYAKYIKQCDCGLYVNTKSNDADKKKLLLLISIERDLEWSVSIV